MDLEEIFEEFGLKAIEYINPEGELEIGYDAEDVVELLKVLSLNGQQEK